MQLSNNSDKNQINYYKAGILYLYLNNLFDLIKK
jgi:hypothetical protein